jgi:hypothetical protein
MTYDDIRQQPKAGARTRSQGAPGYVLGIDQLVLRQRPEAFERVWR